MMPRLDLHLHTCYSDGDHSPAEVVELAQRAQVLVMAITDHDITAGIGEAVTMGQQLGITVITGVEVSARYQGQETHILGYGIDPRQRLFQDRLRWLRETRETRIRSIVDRLRQLGLPIQHEDIQSITGAGAIGRPHIAQVLLERGYVQTIHEAFERYLAQGAGAYVERDLPSAEDAIAWISEAGGLAVLAHPNMGHPNPISLERQCRTLKAAGLQGIEAWHSSHSPRQIAMYRALARKLDLIVTGGSDFHGRVKPDVHVGIGRGDLHVPTEILQPLQDRVQQLAQSL